MSQTSTDLFDQLSATDQPVRILAVDDSRVMRVMYQEWLGSFGYDVTLAQDGEVAWELCQKENFDLVITDWQMPRRDGLELCWSLRSSARENYIYLILVTASDERAKLVEALDAGADDFIQKPIDPNALRARVRAGERIVRMQRELNRLATTDQLTGVRNRRYFMERSQGEVARARRHGCLLSIIMMDIDYFKKINDTYGHAAGDQALRVFAHLCQEGLRLSDVFGRLGGEEFAIMLPETPLADAAMVAERLRQAAEAAEVPLPEGGCLKFTVSIGVSELGWDESNLEPALVRADGALYRAKNGGRNQVVVEPNA
jgi:diguanylate cyclase (GGDEF)-like protein